MIDRIWCFVERLWCRLFGHDWVTEYDVFPELYAGDHGVKVRKLDWCEVCGERREVIFDHCVPRLYPSYDDPSERARSSDR